MVLEPELETRVVPLQILLVEDDRDLRATLSQALREEGYEVEAASSGSEAIELSTQRAFDLVITDIKLPGADGLTALEAVKQGNPEVAGIVITGYSTEEDAIRAARLRVENYLTKPFHIDEFLAAVDRLSENKRQAQAAAARQLVQQQGLHWLSRELLLAKAPVQPDQMERYLVHARNGSVLESRDPREKVGAETAFFWSVLEAAGFSLSKSLWSMLPERLAVTLQAGGQASLKLQNLATAMLEQEEPEDLESPEAAGAHLEGSVLNVALLLESAGRFQEARQAFLEALRSQDPSWLYRAHFGLARLARQQRAHAEMEKHLDEAVAIGEGLGPMAACEALTERGILLSLSGRPQAQEALVQAREAAKVVKDSTSFALSNLALAHFHGQAVGNRSRLLSHLYQPEYFPMALQAAGWLMEHLLKEEADDDGRRFLQKLLRSAPKSFHFLIENTADETTSLRILNFLHLAPPSVQAVAIQRFSASESSEVRAKLSRWKGKVQNVEQRKSVLRVFSFSGMQLYRDDEALEMKRKKPLLLLLYMLVRNVPVGEESVLELFWPGDEERGRISLRTALSQLRKLIAPDSSLDPFERGVGGIAISKELNVWLDYREFDSLMSQGQRHRENNPQRTVESFRAACRLYRGPFLENVYEDWALEIREQTSVSVLEALRFLTEQCLATGFWAEAHEHAARALRYDELSQPFYEMAMRALLELHRHHEVLQLFEQGQIRLARDLDLEPSIEMVRLREMARLNV